MSDPAQHPIHQRREKAWLRLKLARLVAADYIEVGRFVGDVSQSLAKRLQQDVFAARDEMEDAQSAYDQFIAEKYG